MSGDVWFVSESQHSIAVFYASSAALVGAILHWSLAIRSTPRVVL